MFSTALHKLHDLIRLTFGNVFAFFSRLHPSEQSDLHNDWARFLILSNPVMLCIHEASLLTSLLPTLLCPFFFAAQTHDEEVR